MFGLLARWFGGSDYVRRSDVLLAIQQAQQDLRDSNPEYLRESQERISRIIREHAAAARAAQDADGVIARYVREEQLSDAQNTGSTHELHDALETIKDAAQSIKIATEQIGAALETIVKQLETRDDEKRV